MADIHLRIRVGSDVALLLAMANVISREQLTDDSFINQRTSGSEEFIEHIKEFTPMAAPICEVDGDLIEEAATFMVKEPAAIYYEFRNH